MPAQKLGIKDDKVKVITIDSMTGELVNNIDNLLTDSSPTGDSVDGSVPSDILQSDCKQFNSIQLSLQNASNSASNEVKLNDSQRISGMVSDSGEKFITIQSASSASLDHPSGAATVPQVLFVDSNKSAIDSNTRTILGKRPASSSGQNSVFNKVIITKNPTTSQPQAVPVQIQTVPASGQPQTNSGSLIQTTPKTPTKTITITQHGIISPGKGTAMTQVVGGFSPKLPINKLPISPARTPTKITMIPVSMSGRSPQKILPAGQTLLNNNNNNNSGAGLQTTITMSPSKLLKQPGTVHLIQKPVQQTVSNPSVVTIPARPGAGQVRQMTVQPGNVQQIHVPGNKFHYIRLAAPSTSTQGARPQVIQTRPMLSSSLPSGANAQPQQMKITIPANSAAQMLGPRTTNQSSASIQRIILPAAPNQMSLHPSISTGSSQGTQIIRTTLAGGSGALTQIAPGSTFLAPSGNQQNLQGFALVPASYLSQIQQQIQVKPAITTSQPANNTTVVVTAQPRQDFVPIASNNPSVSASAQSASGPSKTNVNGTSLDGGGGARPRKPCNCTKSQCLKLYCDCFANGEFCHNCNCMNCANNLEHEEERSRAIKSCLDRNPLAFHPKIGKGRAGERDRRHNKGCNCKRSGCLKNYCECYEAKIMCNSSCKCVGCKNFEESPERKTLMHLADAAEVRVLQQTAAKTKLSSQISDLPTRPVSSNTGERLPFSFVTSEVVDATCACLLAQAEEADRQRMPPVVQERMVIEEFGRCLLQIIESANRTKAPDPDDTS